MIQESEVLETDVYKGFPSSMTLYPDGFIRLRFGFDPYLHLDLNTGRKKDSVKGHLFYLGSSIEIEKVMNSLQL